jgi:hypothetical protein
MMRPSYVDIYELFAVHMTHETLKKFQQHLQFISPDTD